MGVEQEKQAVRERVWTLLDKERAVPHGSYGKIPGFHGTDRTVARLAEMEVWKCARIIKANPDYAQLAVRVCALKDGKLLYMAVPKVANEQPFFLLDPEALDLPAEKAAEKSGSARSASRVGV